MAARSACRSPLKVSPTAHRPVRVASRSVFPLPEGPVITMRSPALISSEEMLSRVVAPELTRPSRSVTSLREDGALSGPSGAGG